MDLKKRCLMGLNKIYDSDYNSFRKNLNWLMDNNDVKSKNQLKFLMTESGFRVSEKYGNLSPSNNQLELAMEYVSFKSGKQWETIQPKQEYVTIKTFTYVRNGKTITVKSYRRRKHV
jgi:hypothetical protein